MMGWHNAWFFVVFWRRAIAVAALGNSFGGGLPVRIRRLPLANRRKHEDLRDDIE